MNAEPEADAISLRMFVDSLRACSDPTKRRAADVIERLLNSFSDGAKWIPIESAPKDGSKFLAFGMGHGHQVATYDMKEAAFPMAAICWWGWHDSERDVPVGDGLFRKEPCRVLEGWRGQWAFDPTHWMPLPEAPK